MSDLLSQNLAALRLLFTEDLYLVRKQPGLASKPEINDKKKIKETKPAFEYVGDNLKNVLILINDPIHTKINPVHQEMLLKVMWAIKLDIRDLAIVNMNHYYQVDFNTLKIFFNCNRLILFGLDPITIGLPNNVLNKVDQKDNVKILATHSFEEMRNSEGKKREFWQVLKSF
ncbi:MAG: hypothetical protein H7096_07100 [Flavobacterium sp.]|nr:hypothetical protein [Pedobacter sp.]